MGLVGKLQAETLIMAPAHKFHEVFWCRPHHISTVCPEKVQKVHLHEGDWGNPGSIIEWHYFMGKPFPNPHPPTYSQYLTNPIPLYIFLKWLYYKPGKCSVSNQKVLGKK